MRRTIIAIILLAAAGGGGAYYYYRAHRAAGRELAAAVPADTLLYEYVPNGKLFIERMEEFQHADADTLDSQLQQYRKLAPRFGNAARFLLGMYEAAVKQKTNDQLVPGAASGSPSAMYTVGLVPVMRIQLTDPAAFRRFVQAAERREGARGQDGTFQGVAYRSYDIEWKGRRVATKLLLAIRGDYAVMTLDVPQLRNESLPVALGLKAPTRSLAQTGLPRRILPNGGAPPDNAGFLNHAAIVAALAGASGSAAGEMLTQLDAKHRLARLRTPACRRDLQAMAKVWPMTTWSTRSTRLAGGPGSSGVSLRTHMLSEITDASLAAQLVKLRGHIPPSVMDNSAKPLLVTAFGLNVSSVGSVLGALRRRFLHADFQCGWLVQAQRRVDQSNPLAVSMASGLFGSVKGISLSLFGLQTAPKGGNEATKLQGVDALLTVSAEQPARLIGLLKRMQPRLLGGIDIPADGTPVPVQLPGAAASATARIVGNDVALYHGPRAEQVAQTLTGDDLTPNGVGYYRIDYAKLSEFLAGRWTPQRLGKRLGAADVERLEASLKRMAQTGMRFDVREDFTNDGVVLNAKMAVGNAP